ncbi:hypothetical protein BP6252_02917 [Coleophoma cylindrospora]|uniref:Carboxylic ester hydrolase n=1 Tax=Coleophoma cylindrospora TaxID=1849047 RepID=A0A3D8SG59_9HELO|nr:hypothetical protein BP6252_02917 [Coleophoma cylindrospora]
MDVNSEVTLLHRQLSTTFKGVKHPFSSSDLPIAQFRGIKYGAISARFKQASLVDRYPEHYNATAHGPACPQTPRSTSLEEALNGLSLNQIQATGVKGDGNVDEFECLNLVITTPQQVTSNSGLPVLIYFHGGGNYSGSNSSWFNDGANLVQQSIKVQKPIIFVGINYRLAAFGFLASQALRDDNGGTGGGNYGARDQHLAIEWVYKHITGFGGDPHNITISGESAGALGVQSQIHSLFPSRFSRAILQSSSLSSPALHYPQSLEEKNEIYAKLLAALQVNTVDDLRKVPWIDLLNAYENCNGRNALPELLLVDDEFISASWQENFSFPSWSGKEVLIGDTANEGDVARLLAMSVPDSKQPFDSEKLVLDICRDLSEIQAADLTHVYDISPGKSETEVYNTVLELWEDLAFYHSTSSFIKSVKDNLGKAYRYVFEQLNPFNEGLFYGSSNHSLDLIYLFGSENTFRGLKSHEIENALREAFQDKWIAFMYGLEPWTQSSVYEFGPCGDTRPLSEKEFRSKRRVQSYEVLDTLGPRDHRHLFGVSTSFLIQHSQHAKK